MIVLMPMCAYLSETSRMIQICKALNDRGRGARIATHGGIHEALVNKEGLVCDFIEPRMDAARSKRFVRDGIGIGDPNQSMYAPDEMRAHVLAEAEYFRRNGVEAVVTGFTLTTLISTRIAGIPLITEHAGSFIPPLFERGMLPAPSAPVQPFFKYIPKSLARLLVNKGVARLKLYLEGFSRLARELGVPPVPSFPALLLGDLCLVTEAPEVYGISEAEMAAWRPTGGAYWPTTRFQYTGPLFAELDRRIPDEVEAALRRPGPIVYVAVTSATEDLVRQIVGQVAASGAEVIVAGTVHDLSDMAGPKVTVSDVLPSHRIMPRVALAVTAGGQGSVQCAMAAGTPVIGIPLQPEQDANVHLLERKGAARLMSQSDVARGRLTASVREMLASPGAKSAAKEIQAAYARRDGPGLCAEAIIRYLETGLSKAA